VLAYNWNISFNRVGFCGLQGENLMDFDMIVFGETTLMQLLRISGAVIVGIICIRIVKKLFFKKTISLQHTVYFVCNHCEWEGNMSKFGTHCPKCNHPVG
jgi:hypothetical protein